MTLLDLTLGILAIIIAIEAFIGIRKLGFAEYSIDRGLGMWVWFSLKLTVFIVASLYFLDKINWDYIIY